ncbi:MAG: small multi-drug export protein [Planctomycetes bacterium]|nr:small multi-drug export protein [Planctomycetota bacterium]
MESETEPVCSASSNERIGRLKGQVLTSAEGRVLIAGIAMALVYTLWLCIQLILSVDTFQTLLGMTAMEVVFGRIACMGFGYSMGQSHTQVIGISMILETILVLVFYPLLVFIWRQLLVIRWLKKVSARTRRAAEAHKDKVRKYGIIGLFMFVWFPFWMTGPVVGCMIGYLLGMRVWVNLTTVLVGTYAAILGWAFLLYQLHQKTISYSSYAIVIATAIIAAAMLAWTLRQRLTARHK